MKLLILKPFTVSVLGDQARTILFFIIILPKDHYMQCDTFITNISSPSLLIDYSYNTYQVYDPGGLVGREAWGGCIPPKIWPSQLFGAAREI